MKFMITWQFHQGKLPGIVKAGPIYPVLNTQRLQSMKKAKPGEIPLPQE
jgi:hypothetical protein